MGSGSAGAKCMQTAMRGTSRSLELPLRTSSSLGMKGRENPLRTRGLQPSPHKGQQAGLLASPPSACLLCLLLLWPDRVVYVHGKGLAEAVAGTPCLVVVVRTRFEW